MQSLPALKDELSGRVLYHVVGRPGHIQFQSIISVGDQVSDVREVSEVPHERPIERLCDVQRHRLIGERTVEVAHDQKGERRGI